MNPITSTIVFYLVGIVFLYCFIKAFVIVAKVWNDDSDSNIPGDDLYDHSSHYLHNYEDDFINQ